MVIIQVSTTEASATGADGTREGIITEAWTVHTTATTMNTGVNHGQGHAQGHVLAATVAPDLVVG